MDVTKTKILRIACLIAGCLMVSGSGPIVGFNSYFLGIKDTFNYTQSDVELCASLINLGHKMGFPAGVLQEKVGSRALSAIAAVTSLVSWLLLYFSTFQVEFYTGKAWLMSIYFFLVGLAAAMAFMAAVPINFENFTKSKRGRIVSCLEGCYCVAPAIVALIYSRNFVVDQNFKPQLMNQDLVGFYLISACSWPVFFALGVFFLDSYPPGQPLSEETSLVGQEDEESPNPEHRVETTQRSSDSDQFEYIELPDSTSGTTQKRVPGITHPKSLNPVMLDAILKSDRESVWGMTLLKDVDFQLLLVNFLIFSGVLTLYINNLSSILAAYMEWERVEVFTVVAPLVSALALFLTGPLTDHAASFIPRQVFLIVAHFLLFFGFLILVAVTQNLATLVISMILIELAAGIIYCVTPCILSESYGVYYFGRNWGGVLLGAGLSGWIFQAVFGFYYEETLEEDGTTYCYGRWCFQKTFIISAVLMVLALLLDAVLLQRTVKNYGRYDHVEGSKSLKPEEN